MSTSTYIERRQELQTYFDRTAVDAWARLTSDAPVGRIRATVRAGRKEMRNALLDCLPTDLRGRTVLDAGCGTGALALEAARRGADVLAVDLSPTLVELASERLTANVGDGRVTFRVGDMLSPDLGTFDHIVSMDSLIHYEATDMVTALAGLAARARRSVLFTFIPRTAALVAMHAIGRLLPRSDRAPAFTPLGETRLRQLIAADAGLAQHRCGRTHYVSRGFYTSELMELLPK